MNPFAKKVFDSLRNGLNQVINNVIEGIDQELENFHRQNVPGIPGQENKKTLAQYYANLELDTSADIEEVRKSYRRLMHKYHPDKHSDDPRREELATQICQELTVAYTYIMQVRERKP